MLAHLVLLGRRTDILDRLRARFALQGPFRDLCLKDVFLALLELPRVQETRRAPLVDHYLMHPPLELPRALHVPQASRRKAPRDLAILANSVEGTILMLQVFAILVQLGQRRMQRLGPA